MKIDEITEDRAKAIWGYLSSKFGCRLSVCLSRSGPKMNVYEMKADPGYPESWKKSWSYLYLNPGTDGSVKTVCAGIRRGEAEKKTIYRELLKKLMKLAKRGDVMRIVKKGLLEDSKDVVALPKGTPFEQLLLEHYL